MLTYCSINTPTFQITHATHQQESVGNLWDILFIDWSSWKISCLEFYRVTNRVTNGNQNEVIVFFVKDPDHKTNMRRVGNNMIG